MNHDRISVSDHELARRALLNKASRDLLEAMEGHELTPLEWFQALLWILQPITSEGLKEEWKEPFIEGND
ncbi:hypothetical protein AB3R30_18840 [Leptolyngbyaceae cyanobacterium UHCC 1019]